MIALQGGEEELVDGREVWVAVIHVRPLPGSDVLGHGSAGAYASVVVLAPSESRFREMILAEMEDNGLSVVEFEDVNTYGEGQEKGLLTDEMRNLRESLSIEYPVQYHEFHSYPTDDA